MLNSLYTTPLTGTPYYRSVGIIKVNDNYNRSFCVGKIILERYDEQNFQFIFKSYWKLLNIYQKVYFKEYQV